MWLQERPGEPARGRGHGHAPAETCHPTVAPEPRAGHGRGVCGGKAHADRKRVTPGALGRKNAFPGESVRGQQGPGESVGGRRGPGESVGGPQGPGESVVGGHVVGELRCGLCQEGPGELTGLQGGLHSLDHTRVDPGVPGPSMIAPREPVLQTPRAQLLSRHGRTTAMSTMVSEKMGGGLPSPLGSRGR